MKNRNSKHAGGKKITGLQFMPGHPNRLLITTNDSRLRLYDSYSLVCKYKGLCNVDSQVCVCVCIGVCIDMYGCAWCRVLPVFTLLVTLLVTLFVTLLVTLLVCLCAHAATVGHQIPPTHPDQGVFQQRWCLHLVWQ